MNRFKCPACGRNQYTSKDEDTVPVVRCKDCKHYNTIGCSKGFGWCENIDRGTSDNFYCAEAAVEMGAQDLRKEEAERLEGMK